MEGALLPLCSPSGCGRVEAGVQGSLVGCQKARLTLNPQRHQTFFECVKRSNMFEGIVYPRR